MASTTDPRQIEVRDRAFAELARLKSPRSTSVREFSERAGPRMARVGLPTLLSTIPAAMTGTMGLMGIPAALYGAYKGVEHVVKSKIRRKIKDAALEELDAIQSQNRDDIAARRRHFRVADIVPAASGMPRMCPKCGKTKM